MRHFYIDSWSRRDSLLHRMEPRLKILLVFSFLLLLIFTNPQRYLSLGFYSFFVLFLLLTSRVPLIFYLKRTFILIPFILIVLLSLPFLRNSGTSGSYNLGGIEISKSGVLILWNCSIKSFLSILLLSMLFSTTGFHSLLKALQKLKMPNIFIHVLSFMYRYLFLIQDEMMKIWQAKEARTISRKRRLEFKALASIIAMLFLRSYERAEDVYSAMLARGFRGEINTLSNFKIQTGQVLFLLGCLLYLLSVKIIFG